MNTTQPTTDAVTTKLYRATGEHDEAAYAKFVSKTTRSNMRARDKADAKGRGIWHGFTDADCAEAARSYCVMYRHQFHVFAAADGESIRNT